jgi:hypothetical protein
MSVPSSKSMVMSVRPYLLVDRSMVCFGKPSISISIGVVTRVSISSGVMPASFTMILT